jgi:RNA polymerase sigma-70 factor (sigma-E family)
MPELPHAVAERHGFRDFVASRSGHLHRTACLLTGGDVHLAEDLVQETLGRMYARWRRLSRVDNPSAYAQTALVNTFLSFKRKRSSSERPSDVVVESSAAAVDVPLRLTLVAALRQLPPQDRAVLVLRFWEDRSVEQTAQALGLSASAVRSRSGRALERVRAALGGAFADMADQ